MAGETLKTEAICLSIAPWSQTSHVVKWLAREGPVDAMVKGAARSKSFFLGQYDLNYLCEIVYYVRSRGGLHALRECSPLKLRESLRGDWRRLAAAEHFREVAARLAAPGPGAADWFSLLDGALDRLERQGGSILQDIVSFETRALALAGLEPAVEARTGVFALRGERSIPVREEVARCLDAPERESDGKILLDTARAIGVFYDFHLDGVPRTRRAALMAATTQGQGKLYEEA
ncbi:MAG: DNA repair protein RecO C-terminal domain-containing protein [Kiritimatiellae bacterium]|nr:DNA repair protein RecO C-terminal domain-containing protein [Kiritimatiellia bacterium]